MRALKYLLAITTIVATMIFIAVSCAQQPQGGGQGGGQQGGQSSQLSVEITSPVDGGIYDDTYVYVSVAVNAFGASIWVKTNQGQFFNVGTYLGWGSTLQFRQGTNTVQVYVEKDGVRSPTQTVTFIVDTNLPLVFISSPTNNAVITNNLPAGGVVVSGTAVAGRGKDIRYVFIDFYSETTLVGEGEAEWTTNWSVTNRDLEGDIDIIAYAVDNQSKVGKKITNTIKVDKTYLGRGQYNVWAFEIQDVYVKSSNSRVVLDIVALNTSSDNNHFFILIDNTDDSGGFQPSPSDSWTSDWKTGWGEFWFTNTAGIDADLVVWGWISGANKTLMETNAVKITDDGSTVVNVSSSITHVKYDLGGNRYNYSFVIPYSSIGAGSGDDLNIYVFYGKAGHTSGEGGMRSMFPANASRTNSGAWGNYIVDVTNKSINYKLK